MTREDVEALRAKWSYRGRGRPSFAREPGAGQESVWDYPRPPRVEASRQRVRVCAGDAVLAESRRACRVLETASPPTYYLPPDDVDGTLLCEAPGDSFCEWKGSARYLALTEAPEAPPVAWCYPTPEPPFSAIAGWIAFYPGRVACSVDAEPVRAQAGGFYGGWVTDAICGPFKGEPGTSGW